MCFRPCLVQCFPELFCEKDRVGYFKNKKDFEGFLNKDLI